MSIAEAALEAWMDCSPRGYEADLQNLLRQLPSIAATVPRRSQAVWNKDFGRLFDYQTTQQPLFVQMLRSQNGTVHFLHFWKAFSEATRMADDCVDEGLVSELETLRDSLLRVLDEQNVPPKSEKYESILPMSPSQCAMFCGECGEVLRIGESNLCRRCGEAVSTQRLSLSPRTESTPLNGRRMPTWQLLEEVHRTAAMSASPHFWSAAAEMLAGQLVLDELCPDVMTGVLFTWLREAELWEQGKLRYALPNPWQEVQRWLRSAATGQGLAVCLHIYDVSKSEQVQKLNAVLAHEYSPLKLGGVFHTGVEVNGLEWCFGYNIEEKTGVSCSKPRKHRQHHYRQTVELPATSLFPDDITAIISDLIEEYPGDSYDLLRRNCCHFADDFCVRLGVGHIPGWISRLARLGAHLDTLFEGSR
eukprot:TRINITY_DN79211_c0_g1_i1.p1 TRINITY_DN79211_c0_g1~~TRINITY_DN79211_c0_g1_i1.p1  ORF type:complete len:418 (-),score=88.63 TRINITY_DN79211_c0_g1_i1:41-1294(-)